MIFEPERLALFQLTDIDPRAAFGAGLKGCGFSAGLPGLDVGPDGMDAVRATPAVQELGKHLDWFAPCLRTARLLRTGEGDDLTIALK